MADHQVNGLAENACKEEKRQVRVLRSALEEKLVRELKVMILHWRGCQDRQKTC